MLTLLHKTTFFSAFLVFAGHHHSIDIGKRPNCDLNGPTNVEYIPWIVSLLIAMLPCMVTPFPQLQHRLAHNVRQARIRRGLSQEALALEAEIDRTYVSQIERGIGNPSLRVMSQLSSVLETEVDELLKETGS